MTGQKQYDEREMGLILRRAAELEGASAKAMSLAEIEDAARGAGIDVALVRRAAQELESLPSRPPAAVEGGLWGAPIAAVLERSFPGELDARAWGQISAEIRRQLGIEGEIRSVGHEFEWLSPGVSNPEYRRLRVTVTPRVGRTLVRVEERNLGLAGGLFLGLGMPALGVGLSLVIPLCIVFGVPGLIGVLLPLWIVGTFILLRLLFARTVAARRRRLEALVEGVTEVGRETGSALVVDRVVSDAE